MTLFLLCDECGELRELDEVAPDDAPIAHRYLEADLAEHQLEEHDQPFLYPHTEVTA